MPFTGTIVITQNPVTDWERYHRTLGISVDKDVIGYRNLKVEERAEGGYYRCRFRLYGPREFLSEFLVDGLSRQVDVFHPDGRKKWEGLVYEMKLGTGTAIMRTSLDTLANKVWVRYRITGAGATSRSTVIEDAASQGRYGIKEFVIGCGELEAADISDQVATQYLRLHRNPTPAPTSIKTGRKLIEEPHIEIECRGFFETLFWRVYNNTGAASNQGASVQIADIITAVGQFVAQSELRTNSTLVSEIYDADRKAGDIVADIARLGDVNFNRWLVYMTDGRTFVYDRATPAEPD